MNRVGSLVIVAGLALGCDDPAVRDAIDTALDYGVVSAQADCSITSDSRLVTYQATRFADGSGMAIGSLGSQGTGTRFFSRADGAAVSLKVAIRTSESNNNRVDVSVDGGDIVVFSPTTSPPDTPDTCVIDTCCTVFNLEAFE